MARTVSNRGDFFSPRELLSMKQDLSKVYYSATYADEDYRYRLVTLNWAKPPENHPRKLAKGDEGVFYLGLTMSSGWVHLGWSPSEIPETSDVMVFRKVLKEGEGYEIKCS